MGIFHWSQISLQTFTKEKKKKKKWLHWLPHQVWSNDATVFQIVLYPLAGNGKFPQKTFRNLRIIEGGRPDRTSVEKLQSSAYPFLVQDYVSICTRIHTATTKDDGTL